MGATVSKCEGYVVVTITTINDYGNLNKTVMICQRQRSIPSSSTHRYVQQRQCVLNVVFGCLILAAVVIATIQQTDYSAANLLRTVHSPVSNSDIDCPLCLSQSHCSRVNRLSTQLSCVHSTTFYVLSLLTTRSILSSYIRCVVCSSRNIQRRDLEVINELRICE